MRPLSSLIADLNDISLTVLPVVDETGYEGEVPIDAGTLKDFAELQKAFNRSGFQLEESERDLLMLIIRDK